MPILAVTASARRKAFEVALPDRSLRLPYVRCTPEPSTADPVVEVFVDPELASEAFTYRLGSGAEGTIHVEQVLDYNQDPSYLRDLLLYQLTIAAQERVGASALSRREIIRRLETSAAQFYRLLDQTNYTKSIDQMLRLLHVLDCDVELVVSDKVA